MTPRWTRSATADLASARRYVEQENPDAARALAARILAAVDLLMDAPDIGRPGRVPSTREFVVTRTRYLIVYRVRRKRLDLLRVLHQRQKWP